MPGRAMVSNFQLRETISIPKLVLATISSGKLLQVTIAARGSISYFKINEKN